MIDIFIIDKKNNIKVDPIYLEIPEFKAVWSLDKTAQKASAMIDFKYIYFTTDPRSKIIQSQPADEVEDSVKINIIGKANYEPSAKVLAAKERYRKLIDVKSLKTLKTAGLMLDNTLAYLESVKPAELGKDFKKFVDMLSNIAKLTDQYNEAYKRVLAEMDNSELGGIADNKAKIDKPLINSSSKLEEAW